MLSVSGRKRPIIGHAGEQAGRGRHDVLPAGRAGSAEAAHAVPETGRRALLRGADGRGGVLVRLVAAVPRRRTVGDRRLAGVGTARPRHGREPPADAAAPEAARPLHRRVQEQRRGGPPARARATATSGSRTSSPTQPSPYYRNAIGDECVYVEKGSATVETVFGVLNAAEGDYVIIPRATTHRWLPGRERCARLLHRGEQPHRAAEAVPVPLRTVPRALAVLRTRPARGRPSRSLSMATMSRCW